jgi:enamine deaminase RidA (YjgF/YER057c/UK114 family)
MNARVNANPETVWKTGAYLNQAVAEPMGRRVHLTGQVAWDADGRVIGAGDAGRQTEVALENIRKVLGELGGRLSDVVSLTTYYVRDADKGAISRARAAAFAKLSAPVGTGIRVAGLWERELLVELTVIAVIPADRFREPGEMEA